MSGAQPSITGAVEGAVDQAVLQRIASHLGIFVDPIHVTHGKQNLLKRLRGFNYAANHFPWIVIIDLNGGDCAPEQLPRWLPDPSPLMNLRVAVRAIEAWLLADSQRIAGFLGVPIARIPGNPDTERDPKTTMVNVARHSRRKAIRQDMVPSERSGRKVGPAYEARLIEFALDPTNGWRPAYAATSSDSLRRCLHALE